MGFGVLSMDTYVEVPIFFSIFFLRSFSVSPIITSGSDLHNRNHLMLPFQQNKSCSLI